MIASRYSVPAEFASFSICSADSAEPVVSQNIPHEVHVACMMRRLVALSSTTRTRSPGNGPAVTGERLGWSSFAAPTCTVNKNVLPLPISLSSQMRPPIIVTRRDTMVSPSPVPPYLRVVLLSACEKG